MSQGELLAQIIGRLEGSGIPHMVVGSFASSFHGEPRTTRDIDIVIDPSGESLRRFVSSLPTSDFYVDAGAATEALERRTSFNVIEMATGWKVDLLLRRDRPFSRTEFERRIRTELLGTAIRIATAEDTIIAKLEWATAGESERQFRDVTSILALNRDTLDYSYIEKWVAALDLVDAWKRVQASDDG
ncbi:MAG: hypothetical protein H0U86_01245 [Chloroflexi bacterium]|nr:hypothetical protein [Chloroflexota bacterium]